MKRLFTYIIIFAVTVTAFGQQTFGFKVNGGFSYLTTERKEYPSTPKTQSYYPMFSGQGGLTYSYNFKNKFVIGTELLYNEIEGKEYLKLFSGMTINGNFVSDNGYYETNIFRHIYGIGLPIYIGYNFQKFNINIGFQANFAISSVSENSIISENPSYFQDLYNGGGSIYNPQENELELDKISYGARIGLFYNLSKRYSIEANYYYGLTNLLKENSIFEPPIWNVQQLMIGIRYSFLLPDKK